MREAIYYDVIGCIEGSSPPAYVRIRVDEPWGLAADMTLVFMSICVTEDTWAWSRPPWRKVVPLVVVPAGGWPEPHARGVDAAQAALLAAAVPDVTHREDP